MNDSTKGTSDARASGPPRIHRYVYTSVARTYRGYQVVAHSGLSAGELEAVAWHSNLKKGLRENSGFSGSLSFFRLDDTNRAVVARTVPAGEDHVGRPRVLTQGAVFEWGDFLSRLSCNPFAVEPMGVLEPVPDPDELEPSLDPLSWPDAVHSPPSIDTLAEDLSNPRAVNRILGDAFADRRGLFLVSPSFLKALELAFSCLPPALRGTLSFSSYQLSSDDEAFRFVAIPKESKGRLHVIDLDRKEEGSVEPLPQPVVFLASRVFSGKVEDFREIHDRAEVFGADRDFSTLALYTRYVEAQQTLDNRLKNLAAGTGSGRPALESLEGLIEALPEKATNEWIGDLLGKVGKPLAVLFANDPSPKLGNRIGSIAARAGTEAGPWRARLLNDLLNEAADRAGHGACTADHLLVLEEQIAAVLQEAPDSSAGLAECLSELAGRIPKIDGTCRRVLGRMAQNLENAPNLGGASMARLQGSLAKIYMKAGDTAGELRAHGAWCDLAMRRGKNPARRIQKVMKAIVEGALPPGDLNHFLAPLSAENGLEVVTRGFDLLGSGPSGERGRLLWKALQARGLALANDPATNRDTALNYLQGVLAMDTPNWAENNGYLKEHLRSCLNRLSFGQQLSLTWKPALLGGVFGALLGVVATGLAVWLLGPFFPLDGRERPEARSSQDSKPGGQVAPSSSIPETKKDGEADVGSSGRSAEDGETHRIPDPGTGRRTDKISFLSSNDKVLLYVFHLIEDGATVEVGIKGHAVRLTGGSKEVVFEDRKTGEAGVLSREERTCFVIMDEQKGVRRRFRQIGKEWHLENPDGAALVTISRAEGVVSILDSTDGRLVGKVRTADNTRHVLEDGDGKAVLVAPGMLDTLGVACLALEKHLKLGERLSLTFAIFMRQQEENSSKK